MTYSCTSKNDSRSLVLVRGERNIKFDTRKYRSSSVVAACARKQPDAWRKKFRFYSLVICASKFRGLILLLAVLEQNINVVQSCTRLAPSMSSVPTRY